MKVLSLLAALAAFTAAAHADSFVNFRVNFNFSGLAGSAPYGLEVDLTDAQTLFGTSTVTLGNFTVNGGAFSGATTLTGLATGALGSSVTLTANGSTALSFLSRDFGSGVTSLSFDVAATSDQSVAAPHGLSFFVYDSADYLASSSPDKAFVKLDLSGNAGFANVQTYSGSGVSASVSAIPEPSTYGLLGAGVLAGIAAVRRRRAAPPACK